MAKILECAKVDPSSGCQHVVRGETEEEVLTKAAEHAKEHGIREVTPELMERVKANIRARIFVLKSPSLIYTSRFAQIWSSSKNCGKVSSSLCLAIRHEAAGLPIRLQWGVVCGVPVVEGESDDRAPDPGYGTCR